MSDTFVGIKDATVYKTLKNLHGTKPTWSVRYSDENKWWCPVCQVAITSTEKTKQDREKVMSRKERGFNFKQDWYGCLSNAVSVHRPKEGKEARQMETRVKSPTDWGKKDPGVREGSVCLRNSEEATAAQREGGTEQQKFKLEGSQGQTLRSIINCCREFGFIQITMGNKWRACFAKRSLIILLMSREGKNRRLLLLSARKLVVASNRIVMIAIVRGVNSEYILKKNLAGCWCIEWEWEEVMNHKWLRDFWC